MKEIFTHIKNTLIAQNENTKNLISFQDTKFKAIKENNVDEIIIITNKEEEYARKIIDLEKIRDKLIKNLERKLDKKITDIYSVLEELDNYQDFNENFSKKEKEALYYDLKEASNALRNNLTLLKEKNNINNSLMSFEIDQIEIANNIIQGNQNQNTYTNTNLKKKYSGNKPTATSYFDTKY